MHFLPLVVGTVLLSGARVSDSSGAIAIAPTAASAEVGRVEDYVVRHLELAADRRVALGKRGALFAVSESDQGGEDRNGDGDAIDFVVHYHDYATGTNTNLGWAVGDRWTSLVYPFTASGRWFFIRVDEAAHGVTDLNGDGDALDTVTFVFDSEAGTVRNLGVAPGVYWRLQLDPYWENIAAFEVSEYAQGNEDLNGDGDTEDTVLFTYDAARDELVDTGIACTLFALEGARALITVFEDGADLNGDGDGTDVIVQVYDVRTRTLTNLGLPPSFDFFGEPLKMRGRYIAVLVDEGLHGAQDLNADGDAVDSVLFVADLLTGVTRNSGIAGTPWMTGMSIDQGRVTFPVSEWLHGQSDLNQDGDTNDAVAFVYDVRTDHATNLELAATWLGPSWSPFVVLRVSEEFQGHADFNGDGDADDDVFFLRALNRNLTISTGLAGTYLRSNQDKLVLHVDEARQGGSDLNADGDTIDSEVPHLIDLRRHTLTNLGHALGPSLAADTVGHAAGSDLIAFAVDEFRDNRDHDGSGSIGGSVIFVHDAATGATANLAMNSGGALPIEVRGDRVLFLTHEAGGEDWNGDGDSNDFVPVLVERIR